MITEMDKLLLIAQSYSEIIKQAGSEDRAQEIQVLLSEIKKLVHALEIKYDPQRNSGLISAWRARFNLGLVQESIEGAL